MRATLAGAFHKSFFIEASVTWLDDLVYFSNSLTFIYSEN